MFNKHDGVEQRGEPRKRQQNVLQKNETTDHPLCRSEVNQLLNSEQQQPSTQLLHAVQTLVELMVTNTDMEVLHRREWCDSLNQLVIYIKEAFKGEKYTTLAISVDDSFKAFCRLRSYSAEIRNVEIRNIISFCLEQYCEELCMSLTGNMAMLPVSDIQSVLKKIHELYHQPKPPFIIQTSCEGTLLHKIYKWMVDLSDTHKVFTDHNFLSLIDYELDRIQKPPNVQLNKPEEWDGFIQLKRAVFQKIDKSVYVMTSRVPSSKDVSPSPDAPPVYDIVSFDVDREMEDKERHRDTLPPFRKGSLPRTPSQLNSSAHRQLNFRSPRREDGSPRGLYSPETLSPYYDDDTRQQFPYSPPIPSPSVQENYAVEYTTTTSQKLLEKEIERLNTIVANYETRVNEMRMNYDKRIEEMRTEYERRIEEMRNEYERRMTEKKDEYEMRMIAKMDELAASERDKNRFEMLYEETKRRLDELETNENQHVDTLVGEINTRFTEQDSNWSELQNLLTTISQEWKKGEQNMTQKQDALQKEMKELKKTVSDLPSSLAKLEGDKNNNNARAPPRAQFTGMEQTGSGNMVPTNMYSHERTPSHGNVVASRPSFLSRTTTFPVTRNTVFPISCLNHHLDQRTISWVAFIDRQLQNHGRIKVKMCQEHHSEYQREESGLADYQVGQVIYEDDHWIYVFDLSMNT